MKLLNVLKNYVAPTILGAITIDSYRRQVFSHTKEIIEIKNTNKQKIEELQQELWGEKTVNDEFKLKLQTNSKKILDIDTDITDKQNQLSEINVKLSNKNYESSESIETLNKSKEYITNELSKLDISKSEQLKELQNSIDSVNKSDIFSSISDLIEKYQSILNNLSLEQLVALFNIICNFMFLTTLTSIGILLVGDYLIKNLNLETKYPKIYKFIKIKEKLNKHYLIFYIVFFYLLIILCLIGNIYMLVLKYFV